MLSFDEAITQDHDHQYISVYRTGGAVAKVVEMNDQSRLQHGSAWKKRVSRTDMQSSADNSDSKLIDSKLLLARLSTLAVVRSIYLQGESKEAATLQELSAHEFLTSAIKKNR